MTNVKKFKKTAIASLKCQCVCWAISRFYRTTHIHCISIAQYVRCLYVRPSSCPSVTSRCSL